MKEEERESTCGMFLMKEAHTLQEKGGSGKECPRDYKNKVSELIDAQEEHSVISVLDSYFPQFKPFEKKC